MLLKKLILHNYSVFYGTQTIRLEPSGSSDTANIILIGGKNGSGKTSILDALRVAFYGSSVLNGRSSKDQYDSVLGKCFNKRAVASGDNTMSIEVEVAVAVENTLSDIAIRRSWNFQETGKIIESLEVLKDGEVLNPLEAQQVEEFVRELIPQGISEFFLLDAEKIDKLALDEMPPPSFTAALRSLLDIDIIERLSIDLDKVTRDSRLKEKEKSVDQLFTAQSRLDHVNAEIGKLKNRGIENKIRLKELTDEEHKLESDLRNRGVLQVEDRERLECEEKEGKVKFEIAKKELDHLLGELVPFLFVETVIGQFENQLISEQESQQHIFAGEQVSRFGKDLMTRIKRSNKYGISTKKELLKNIKSDIDDLLEKKYCVGSLRESILHGYGARKTEEIIGQLREIQELGTRKVTDLINDYKMASSDLQKIENELARIPAEADAADVVESLKKTRESIQEIHKDIGTLNEQIKQKERECILAQREVKNATRFLEHRNKAKRRVEHIGGLQRVLKAFSRDITKARIQEISDYATDMHRQIARKKGEIARINIDPDTLDIQLYDWNDSLLSKERLSKGEKQVYAMSLLYGLAQASGKQLPVIVDTPLARFDEDHKQAMVTRYFPATGQQMILLTTDVEMDSAHFQMVEDHLSHTILLDYHDDIRSTIVKDGFFRGMEEECHVSQ